ncbi:MAG: hypothetical protein LBQ54_10415 [Planctomycetaceae bacterium]|jgi:hypothetical protein|nr:hypothetical protein [Planctomycetaceae bacterium]
MKIRRQILKEIETIRCLTIYGGRIAVLLNRFGFRSIQSQNGAGGQSEN